jgi:hypothetical protein
MVLAVIDSLHDCTVSVSYTFTTTALIIYLAGLERSSVVIWKAVSLFLESCLALPGRPS